MKKSAWILGLILLSALFLRLFRLTELFHFTMDEELIAWRAWGWFNLDRPFLIGGISPLQIHLPPYFYYLMAILIWPFNFNPLGWGISGALIGVVTIYALYRLTLRLFDQKAALVAAGFQAFSFTAVFFDRHFWPMSLSPLLIILTLSLLTKLSRKSFWPYLALAGILLLAFSSDPSNLTLALALLVYFIFKRRSFSLKYSFVSLLILLILFFTPLFLFDLRHDWQNFGGLNRLWQTTASRQFSFNNLWTGLLLLPKVLARFWYSAQTSLIELYSYCVPYAQARQNIPPVILVPAITVLIWFMVKLKNLSVNLLILAYVFGLSLFSLLGFSLFDHYLTGLLPIFSLISAVVIARLPKFLGWSLITLFIFFNLIQFGRASHPYGLKFKQALVAWVNQSLSGESYNLDSISKCHQENGLRYLFELSGNPPQTSFIDPNFSWLYPQAPSTSPVSKTVLVTDKPDLPVKPIFSSGQFGAMKVYILN